MVGKVVVVVDEHECIGRIIKRTVEQRFKGEVEVLLGAKDDGMCAVELVEGLVDSGNYQNIVAVVVGHHLKRLSGNQVVAACREIEMKYGYDCRVLIVGTTADLSDEDEVRMKRAGADFVIWKPIDSAILGSIIATELVTMDLI